MQVAKRRPDTSFEFAAVAKNGTTVWIEQTVHVEFVGRRATEFHAVARNVNVAMLGAVAAALGEPPLAEVADSACAMLGKKVDPNALRAAVQEGYACLS